VSYLIGRLARGAGADATAEKRAANKGCTGDVDIAEKTFDGLELGLKPKSSSISKKRSCSKLILCHLLIT